MVGRQGNEVVEDPRTRRAIALEGADLLVSLGAEFGAVVIDAHQLGTIVSRHILACCFPSIEHLLAEVQRPVEARRVVVDELRVRHDFADAVDHFGDLLDVRLFGFDPQKVGAVLERRDAVKHDAVDTGAGAELVEVRGQALGGKQLAVAADEHLAIGDVGGVNFVAIEEAVVLVAQIAGLRGVGDLFGEAGAERVGARDDDPVFHAHFEEGHAAGADLLEEVFMRHGDLAVLVAALLFVRHLIFDLQRAGARFDHLLGEQVGRLGVAEACVDVGDDRHHVGFVVVDHVFDALGFHGVTSLAGGVERAEHHAEFAGVSLPQEGVEFLDQRGHRGLLVHRLVGQGAKLAAQRGDHPARKVEVTLLGGAEVLLDRDQLLLRDEAVPAAQRLGVLRRVCVIGVHIGAHDLGGVFGDVEAGGETVLDHHTGGVFGVDRGPARPIRGNDVAHPGDGVLVSHVLLLSDLGRGLSQNDSRRWMGRLWRGAAQHNRKTYRKSCRYADNCPETCVNR